MENKENIFNFKTKENKKIDIKNDQNLAIVLEVL
jgi:hypothetical protein